MTDISPPKGLAPKSKFFAEVGEDMINVDGAIQLLMSIDTPQARSMRRIFRRKFAEWRMRTDLTPEKQREGALFAAFEAAGIVVTNMGTLPGTMD